MSPVAWSSRWTYIGVSDSGRPFSRPKLRHGLGHPSPKRGLGRLGMPQRAHHQAPLRPAGHLFIHLMAHGHGILVPLGDHFRLALSIVSNDRGQDLFTPPDDLERRI